MITILIFIGKSSLALLLFFLFYYLILAKDKLFKRNRFYLISSCIVPFVLPWLTIPIFNGVSSKTLTLTYIEGSNSVVSQLSKPEYQSVNWVAILLLIYFVGAFVFLLKTLTAYFQVYKIIKSALHIPIDKLKIASTPHNISPFSFLNWVVIPSHIQQHPSFEKMVQHEMIHCRQYHSVDLFIAEILILTQWFNPFAWFLRKSISENLEYLVDEEMLKKGTDAKVYQYSLLSFSMVGLKPAVANYFNTNLLKKRIKMMNTNNYPRRHRFHNLLIPVCLLFAVLLTASFKKQENTRLRTDNLRTVKSTKAIPDIISANIVQNDSVIAEKVKP